MTKKPTTHTKADILNEAIGVTTERNTSYDSPEDNFERIARNWNAHLINTGRPLEKPLTPNDVSAMMALMKLARLQFNPNHHDSWVDVAGYAGCGGQIASQNRAKK